MASRLGNKARQGGGSPIRNKVRPSSSSDLTQSLLVRFNLCPTRIDGENPETVRSSQQPRKPWSAARRGTPPLPGISNQGIADWCQALSTEQLRTLHRRENGHQLPSSSLHIARFSSSGARFMESITLNPSRNPQSNSTSATTPTEIGERRTRSVRSRPRSGKSRSSVPRLLTPRSLSLCLFGLTDLVSPSSVSLSRCGFVPRTQHVNLTIFRQADARLLRGIFPRHAGEDSNFRDRAATPGSVN